MNPQLAQKELQEIIPRIARLMLASGQTNLFTLFSSQTTLFSLSVNSVPVSAVPSWPQQSPKVTLSDGTVPQDTLPAITSLDSMLTGLESLQERDWMGNPCEGSGSRE